MIVSIQGPSDIGCTLGLDDSVFLEAAKGSSSGKKIADFSKRIGLPVDVLCEKISPWDYGIDRMDMGYGLQVNLTEQPFVREWWAQAQTYALKAARAYFEQTNDEYYHVYPMFTSREETEAEIAKAFAESSVLEASITYYALGIYFLRLDIDYHGSVSYLIEFYRSFEGGIYESPDPDKHSHTTISMLRPQMQALIDVFQSPALNRNDSALVRHRLADIPDDDLTPWLTLLITCGKDEPFYETLDVVKQYDHEQEHVTVTIDPGILSIGYAAIVFKHEKSDLNDFLYPLQVAQVFWQTALTFEGYLADLTRLYTNKVLSFRSPQFREHEILQIRSLVFAVIQMTDLTAASHSVTPIEIFSVFRKQFGQIETARDRIRWANDVFANLAADASAALRQKRDFALNAFIVIITAITIVGAIAEVINTIDYDQHALPTYSTRALIVLLPALLMLLIAAVMVNSNRKY